MKRHSLKFSALIVKCSMYVYFMLLYSFTILKVPNMQISREKSKTSTAIPGSVYFCMHATLLPAYFYVLCNETDPVS